MAKFPEAKFHSSCAAPSLHQLSTLRKQGHSPSQLADIAALKNVLGAGVGMFGLGALTRVGKEIPTLLGNPPSPTTMTGAPLPVEVPIPMDPEEQRRHEAAGLGGPLGLKMAANGMLGQAATSLYDNALKPALELADPLKATNTAGKWWQNPAMIGGGLAAGAGGWKLVDWLADKHRDSLGDADLLDAKREYESAVQGLHPKAACLDAARDAMQKQAGGMDPVLQSPFAPNVMKNVGGMGLQSLATLATVTGIPTGILAYQYAKNTSDSKALQEALLARRRTQQMRNPAPPHLVLQPAA